MIFNFFGPNNNYFNDAFFGPTGVETTVIDTGTSTSVTVEQPTSGLQTTFTGSGFTYDVDGDPLGGTITGMSFAQSGNVVATYTNISWDFTTFINALLSAETGDPSHLVALFNSSDIIVDASSATVGLDMGVIDIPIAANYTITGSDFADILNGSDGNDWASGGQGRDVLSGGAGADTLLGGAKADILNGGRGKDVLRGGSGDDELYGDGSADELFGEGGNDTVYGGAGGDTLSDGDGDDTMYGGDGDDVFVQGSGSDHFDGGAGVDSLLVDLNQFTLPVDFVGYWDLELGVGGMVGNPSLSDTAVRIQNVTVIGDWDFNLTGNNEANQLTGGGGDDLIIGGGGDDVLSGGRGRDVIYDGGGNDLVYGNGGNDTFYLGGEGGEDFLDGGAGNDTMIIDVSNATPYLYTIFIDLETGNSGAVETTYGRDTFDNIENFTVIGTWNVIITGDANANILIGGNGDDEIHGGHGDDTLMGGLGDDVFYAGGGDGTTDGGAGDDVIHNGGGTDVFIGGTGFDMLVTDVSAFPSSGDVLELDLMAGTHGRYNSTIGQDTISEIEGFRLIGDWDSLITGDAEANEFYTDKGRDEIHGGGGGDLIVSGNGVDTLFGDAGQDTLKAGGGNDVLKGGGGNDILDGGKGRDKLFGGNGADTFIFDAISDSTTAKADVVKDFALGVDLLDLSGITAGLSFIGTAGFSGTAGEVRATVNSGDTLVRVDVDGDGSADMKIVLDAVTGLSIGDFIL